MLLLVAVLCSFGVRLPSTVLPTGDGVRVVPAPAGTEPHTSPYRTGGDGDPAGALTRPVGAPKQVTIAVTDGSSGDQVPVIEGPDVAITNHRRTPVVLSCSFARIGSHRPPTVVDLIGPTYPGQTYHFWSAPMGSPGTAGRYDVTCVDQGTG